MRVMAKETVNKSANSEHKTSFHCFQAACCLVLSVFSVFFCVLITLRTSHLEHRMQFLESERLSVLRAAPPSVQDNLSLWDAVEKLIHKVRWKIQLQNIRVKDDLDVLDTNTKEWSRSF
ncbi:collagen alpha-1(XXIII) chain isoform X1 [Tachysurus ichikawai]